MLTKEQEKEYHDAMDKYHNEMDAKWNKAKEELNGLIEPKYFDFAMSNETYYSEGIVEIVKFKPQYTSYPNSEHCKEGGLTYIKTTNEIECYDFDSEYEGKTVEYWVWQTTNGMEGDSYSGFLLLPLLDGKRFWKVGYSC
jgi:hypothetical protein